MHSLPSKCGDLKVRIDKLISPFVSLYTTKIKKIKDAEFEEFTFKISNSILL